MREFRGEIGRKRDMMFRKMLWEALSKNLDDYRLAKPQTADMDINLVKAYCAGSSAAHVALDCSCAESTVYRAISRVREFLGLKEDGAFFQPLMDHISENPPNYGECNAQSILEMLFETYSDYNRMENDSTKMGFHEIYRLLEDCPLTALDPVIYAVCDLCRSYQKTGFTEGIKVGVLLGNELKAS